MQTRLLELFFESTLSCAVLLDRQFNFIRVNRAYANACRRDPSEFPGRNHFDLYPSDAKAIFEEVVRTGQPYTARSRPFQFPDHPERGVTYWDWNLAPVLNDSGDVETLIFCLDEVTDQRRAEERLRHTLDQLRNLSTMLVDIQENERRRIARVLHDEIGQELTAVKLIIGNYINASGAGQDRTLRGALAGVNEVMDRVRQISLDLRPPVLDDLGLLPALVWLIDRCYALTGLTVSFKHSGVDERLPQEIETAAYRIAQEALTNVARHAGVQRASLAVSGTEHAIMLKIADRGRGFDLPAVLKTGTSSGLMGMRERARALGGRVTVEAAPGAGTTVLAELPFGSQASS
ncbi:MAG: PAS domain-containing protein [Burkholderiales bacterium]